MNFGSAISGFLHKHKIVFHQVIIATGVNKL